jgi:hypothetical protein
VRLSKRKIEYLAGKVLKAVQENRRVHVLTHPDLVVRTVADAIATNLQAEVELDEEVERLLAQHRAQIAATDVDLSLLRQKMKRELARKRGFTL